MKTNLRLVQIRYWNIHSLALGILCVLLGSSTSAATITPPAFGAYQEIPARRAVVRIGDEETEAPAALYDGTGLNHKNPLLASHSADPAAAWQATLSGDDYPVSVEFDLGDEFLVNEMWLWQLPEALFPGQGVAEFDIVMRDGNGHELGVLNGAAGGPKSSGLQPVPRFNAFGECVFLPIPDCVRFVELRIYKNLGALDTVGLEEVSFFGRAKIPPVPEPASCGLLAMGCLAVLHRVRVLRR